jgi:hypothetical protein
MTAQMAETRETRRLAAPAWALAATAARGPGSFYGTGGMHPVPPVSQ